MRLPLQADYTDGAAVILVDYPPALEATVTADATGTATVLFDPVDNNFFWRIERITTFCDRVQPAYALCLVYEGPETTPIRIRDGSSAPQLDIADQSAPITIHANRQLAIQWTGLVAGTKASVAVQYQLWRRVIRGS